MTKHYSNPEFLHIFCRLSNSYYWRCSYDLIKYQNFRTGGHKMPNKIKTFNDVELLL